MENDNIDNINENNTTSSSNSSNEIASSLPTPTENAIATPKESTEKIPKEERWIEFEVCRLEEDEKEDNFNLFGDPDPYEQFEFSFPKGGNVDTNNDNSNDNDNDNSNINDKNEISITLRGYKHEHERIFDSTGLTLWRASKLLCDFLCSNSYYVENKNVLELGSGLGLCGILAHRLHANKVVMTDGDTDVLVEMRNNVDYNLKDECDGKNYHHDETDNVNDANDANDANKDEEEEAVTRKPSEDIIPCRQLLWGKQYIDPFKASIAQYLNKKKSIDNDNITTSTTSTNTNATTRNSSPSNDGTFFDVIIASDVIYVEYILDDLFDTITGMLSPCNSDAKFVLAYARRAVDISLVFQFATKHGLVWTTPNNDETEGVYIFSRQKGN